MPHLKATHLLFSMANVILKDPHWKEILCICDIKHQANIIAKFTSIKKETPLKCVSVLCYG